MATQYLDKTGLSYFWGKIKAYLSTWTGSSSLSTTSVGTLGGAAAKAVDTTISDGSDSVNLPTSAAVASFIENKGYTTNTGTVTQITAGAGLSGGTITTSGTIAHSNSVTAQTTQGVYPIKIDTEGHISEYGTAITIPPEFVILSYGTSTWNDFINAYNTNSVVYCRASSNSNPASGSQTRLAFMAYVNNATTPTQVEFQYYRSVSSHSDSQQGDQVYVYTLTSAGAWSVTVREAYSKIAVSGDLSKSYSSGTITLSATIPTITDTYSGTSTDGMSGVAVKSAIDALDGSLTGTPGVGKTLTALSQTDGIVSATFGDISITKSQISDFPTLGDASTKAVDTSISTASTSTNLPTSNAVASFVEGKGYSTLALGTTSTTAFRGDYGDAAYAHAVTNKGSAFPSGLYKITTNSEGHVTAATAITKSDITALGIPESDTTYGSGTSALLSAGTDTADKVWSSKILHDYIMSSQEIIRLPEALKRALLRIAANVAYLNDDDDYYGDLYEALSDMESLPSDGDNVSYGTTGT